MRFLFRPPNSARSTSATLLRPHWIPALTLSFDASSERCRQKCCYTGGRQLRPSVVRAVADTFISPVCISSNQGPAKPSAAPFSSDSGPVHPRIADLLANPRHTPAVLSALHDILIASCHTLHRLKLENYPLEDTLALKGDSEEYHATPRQDPSSPKRKAVVLDCEMVGAAVSEPGRVPDRDRDDEAVAVSLIDFFTGEVLINSIVNPQRPVDDWRSAVTGMTPAIMSAAVARGEALQGREAVRARLWEYVDENTVLVGHSLSADLRTLRLLHTRIVDSAILAAEPAFGRRKKIGRKAGLKKLCRELLGLEIRNGALASGGCVHDSMEDVLVAREVVVWCLQNPYALQSWAGKNWHFELTKKNGKLKRLGRNTGGQRRSTGSA